MGKILFSFDGRIGRQTFWVVLISELVLIYGLLAFNTRMHSVMVGAALLVMLPVMVWVTLATHVKRWHDLERSGWMVLIGLVPIIGAVIVLGWAGCTKGTTGPNKYGDDPVPGMVA